jgi:hypothetical protein
MQATVSLPGVKHREAAIHDDYSTSPVVEGGGATGIGCERAGLDEDISFKGKNNRLGSPVACRSQRPNTVRAGGVHWVQLA